ncbi:MAG: Ku protein [Actinobacteria bacterium]|nr:MAG: Ku protein [Actinomycetota bacterium]
MAARSIASLSLSFGLVSIPVKLYSATESGSTVRFNLLAPDGSRMKQQYVSEKDQKVVARADMVKGYEFEKDHFVLFTPDELKALEESSSHVVEIVHFIPEKAVDPIYYDKAYLLAPDKRGGKPYTLLMEAMRESGRCALARWAWKSKQYVVQIRPTDGGLVLQQLLYADEVRSARDLGIEKVEVSKGELQLALQLIEQISTDTYDPAQYEDEVKERWGDTDAYKESARRASQYTKDDWLRIKSESGANIERFAELLRAGAEPTGTEAKDVAEEHRAQISRWFYDCGYEIHRGLAEMYVADPRFTKVYEDVEPGLARFISEAIIANAERRS